MDEANHISAAFYRLVFKHIRENAPARPITVRVKFYEDATVEIAAWHHYNDDDGRPHRFVLFGSGLTLGEAFRIAKSRGWEIWEHPPEDLQGKIPFYEGKAHRTEGR